MLSLLAAGCSAPECRGADDAGVTVSLASFVAVDESLLGRSLSSLRHEFGEPCTQPTDHWRAWALVGNKTVPCIYTSRYLGVRFEQGVSVGYYVGEW